MLQVDDKNHRVLRNATENKTCLPLPDVSHVTLQCSEYIFPAGIFHLQGFVFCRKSLDTRLCDNTCYHCIMTKKDECRLPHTISSSIKLYSRFDLYISARSANFFL